LALLLLATWLIATRCGSAAIVMTAPRAGAIIENSAFSAAGLVSPEIERASVVVQVDGVDLIAALGLTAPFADAGGIVAIGPDLVTVSGFDFATNEAGWSHLDLSLSGLPLGSHSLSLAGASTGTGVGVIQTAGFTVVVPLAPRDGALIDDSVVPAAGSVSSEIERASVAVQLDSVDLIAALGLTAPFAGAGGVVAIGPDLVTVSGFDFATNEAGWSHITLSLSGLPLGSHSLSLAGVNAATGAGMTQTADFAIVAPFTQEVQVLVSSGAPHPLQAASSTLFGATLGQPLAAPPVGLPGGSELRTGFAEVAEARIAGGLP
jgi:hypothetical protein